MVVRYSFLLLRPRKLLVTCVSHELYFFKKFPQTERDVVRLNNHEQPWAASLAYKFEHSSVAWSPVLSIRAYSKDCGLELQRQEILNFLTSYGDPLTLLRTRISSSRDEAKPEAIIPKPGNLYQTVESAPDPLI